MLCCTQIWFNLPFHSNFFCKATALLQRSSGEFIHPTQRILPTKVVYSFFPFLTNSFICCSDEKSDEMMNLLGEIRWNYFQTCPFFIYKDDLGIISTHFVLLRLNILVLGGNAGVLELYAYGMYKIASLTDVRHIIGITIPLYPSESLMFQPLHLNWLCRSWERVAASASRVILSPCLSFRRSSPLTVGQRSAPFRWVGIFSCSFTFTIIFSYLLHFFFCDPSCLNFKFTISVTGYKLNTSTVSQ